MLTTNLLLNINVKIDSCHNVNKQICQIFKYCWDIIQKQLHLNMYIYFVLGTIIIFDIQLK